MSSDKILVVDDEEDLCQILKFNLQNKGYEVEIAYSAEEALGKDIGSYSLVLLDVMMQDMSGFQMLDKIRKELDLKTPVIFITAMSSENKLMEGFNLGADDYIKKPFSVNEVLARVKAVIERYKKSNLIEKNNISGKLDLDEVKKCVFINKEPVDFTKTEYDIFTLLFNHPGKVYSRDEILDGIWDNQQNIMGRTVDVNITRIRKKIGDWSSCIVTRSGYGYYFDERKIPTKLVNV